MAKFFRKFSWKKIISIVLAVLLSIAAIAGVSALVGYLKDDKKTIHPSFDQGCLDQTTGKYVECDDMIYTEDAFQAKGLEIKLDFNSTVKYQVFFYDEFNKFISASLVLTESQEFVVPLNAYARVVIEPIWGEDAPLEPSIAWYEISKYADQLEIRVDKEQSLRESDFTKYSLTESSSFVLHEGQTLTNTGAMSVSEEFDLYEFSLDSTVTDGYALETDCLVFAKFDKIGAVGGTANIGLWIVNPAVDSANKAQYYGWGDFKNFTLDNPLEVPKGCKLYVQLTEDFLTAYDVDVLFYFCQIV